MSPLRLLAPLLLLMPGLRVRADDDARKIADFKPRGGNLSAAAISDDGKFLLLGEDDGLLTLWNVKTGLELQNFAGHWPRGVFATALLPDGKRAVSSGDDNRVMILDLVTGKTLRAMGTGDSIPWVMSCNRDGSLAATGCNDGRIFLWDLATGRLVATLRHGAYVCSLLFSPDGKTLAAGYFDGRVILWNTSGWTSRIILPSADSASVGALAFSADSRLLATGNQNGGGFIWNVADGTRFSSFAGYAHPETTPVPHVGPIFPGSVITPDSRGSILFLTFSPDASMVMGSIQDSPARFWDTKTGRFLGTADWFEDERFYVARYGFTFATAAVTPRRDILVNFEFSADDDPEYYSAQVWRLTFTPSLPSSNHRPLPGGRSPLPSTTLDRFPFNLSHLPG